MLRRQMPDPMKNIDKTTPDVLSGLGILEDVMNDLRTRQRQALIIHTDDGVDDLLLGDTEWQDLEIEITLDSGCVDHVVDAAEAPGYCILQSAGSRRKQNFIVGNGAPVPNQGQIHLNLTTEVGGGIQELSSTFQVAKITRPLMSVSRICDQGLRCLFTNEKAQVLGKNSEVVCEFVRRGGLYVANMKLKKPTEDETGHNRALPFQRPSR